jgi:hypothetical protein
MEWIEALSGTPMPTILVIAGLFFIFLAIAGGVSGKIQVPPNRQKQSAITGGVLIAIGLLIYISGVVERDKSESSYQPRTDYSPVQPAATPDGTPDSGASATVVQNVDTDETTAVSLDAWPIKYDAEYFRQNSRWPEPYEGETQRGRLSRSYFNGEPVLSASDFGSGIYWQTRMPIQPLKDFEVDADFTWSKSTTGYGCVGFVFRDVGARYYVFRACSHGFADFVEHVEDREPQWKTYRRVELYGLVRSDRNNLTVRAHGDDMYFLVNDKVVIKLQDGDAVAGNLGLYQETNQSGTMELKVQNFALYTPD